MSQSSANHLAATTALRAQAESAKVAEIAALSLQDHDLGGLKVEGKEQTKTGHLLIDEAHRLEIEHHRLMREAAVEFEYFANRYVCQTRLDKDANGDLKEIVFLGTHARTITNCIFNKHLQLELNRIVSALERGDAKSVAAIACQAAGQMQRLPDRYEARTAFEEQMHEQLSQHGFSLRFHFVDNAHCLAVVCDGQDASQIRFRIGHDGSVIRNCLLFDRVGMDSKGRE